MFTYACSLSSSELLAGSILLTEVSEFTFSRAVSLEFFDLAECDLDSSLKLFETDLDMDNTSSSLLFDGECDDYVLFVKMGTNFLFGYCVKAGESILLILSTGLYSM